MTDLRQAAQQALDALDSNNPDIQLRAAVTLRAALAAPQPEPLSDLYNELLFAVGKKHPNETRHQTALRYLKQAEATSAASTKAHNIGSNK